MIWRGMSVPVSNESPQTSGIQSEEWGVRVFTWTRTGKYFAGHAVVLMVFLRVAQPPLHVGTLFLALRRSLLLWTPCTRGFMVPFRWGDGQGSCHGWTG